MVTKYLATDISWDEAPNGIAVLHAYGDPLTKADPWTIGFGSTGADIREDTVWTAEYAAHRRDLMIADVIDHLTAALPWFASLDDVRQDVFVNMGYQMGWHGLLKFTSTLSAAARGAWDTCAADMRNSLWDRQTHGRAERLIEQVRTGVRVPRIFDHTIADTPQPTPVTVPAQPKEPTLMSLLSSAFHFVFDALTANTARAATSSNTATAVIGSAALDTVTAAGGNATGGPNSAAGTVSPVIKQLEDDLNAAVFAFAKATIDQFPAIGAVAETTGLDTKVANAGVALLALGEQHALTYIAGLFHAHKTNVTSQVAA